jgi:hypothetical protein
VKPEISVFVRSLPPRAPGLEGSRYYALRTWGLAVVVGAGAGSRASAGARRRPARRGQERGQLGPRHPRHQLGGRAGLAARSRAAGGARLTPRLAATRSAPNPRAYPAHPRLDHAGEEENRRKCEKSEIWSLAAAAAAAAAAAQTALTSPHQPRLPCAALAFLGLVGPLAGGRAPEPAQ